MVLEQGLEPAGQVFALAVQRGAIDDNGQPRIVRHPVILAEQEAFDLHHIFALGTRLRFGLSASSIQTGAWSLVFSQPRTWRST